MGVLMGMGNYEPEVRELMKTIIRPGMRCIDAGASTGYYTCLMGTLVGAVGKVHAFEPMPESFRMLNKNVEENNLGRVVDVIKIDVEGYEMEALAGMSRIIRDHRPVIFSEINEYWLRTCAQTSGKAYLEYLNDLGYRVCNVKFPEVELQVSEFRMDILDSVDVIAYARA
jgi:hypothetical protein